MIFKYFILLILILLLLTIVCFITSISVCNHIGTRGCKFGGTELDMFETLLAKSIIGKKIKNLSYSKLKNNPKYKIQIINEVQGGVDEDDLINLDNIIDNFEKNPFYDKTDKEFLEFLEDATTSPEGVATTKTNIRTMTKAEKEKKLEEEKEKKKLEEEEKAKKSKTLTIEEKKIIKIILNDQNIKKLMNYTNLKKKPDGVELVQTIAFFLADNSTDSNHISILLNSIIKKFDINTLYKKNNDQFMKFMQDSSSQITKNDMIKIILDDEFLGSICIYDKFINNEEYKMYILDELSRKTGESLNILKSLFNQIIQEFKRKKCDHDNDNFIIFLEDSIESPIAPAPTAPTAPAPTKTNTKQASTKTNTKQASTVVESTPQASTVVESTPQASTVVESTPQAPTVVESTPQASTVVESTPQASTSQALVNRQYITLESLAAINIRGTPLTDWITNLDIKYITNENFNYYEIIKGSSISGRQPYTNELIDLYKKTRIKRGLDEKLANIWYNNVFCDIYDLFQKSTTYYKNSDEFINLLLDAKNNNLREFEIKLPTTKTDSLKTLSDDKITEEFFNYSMILNNDTTTSSHLTINNGQTVYHMVENYIKSKKLSNKEQRKICYDRLKDLVRSFRTNPYYEKNNINFIQFIKDSKSNTERIQQIIPNLSVSTADAPGQQESADAPGQQESADVPEQQESADAPGQQSVSTADMPEQQESADVPGQQELADAPEQQESADAPEQQVLPKAKFRKLKSQELASVDFLQNNGKTITLDQNQKKHAEILLNLKIDFIDYLQIKIQEYITFIENSNSDEIPEEFQFALQMIQTVMMEMENTSLLKKDTFFWARAKIILTIPEKSIIKYSEFDENFHTIDQLFDGNIEEYNHSFDDKIIETIKNIIFILIQNLLILYSYTNIFDKENPLLKNKSFLSFCIDIISEMESSKKLVLLLFNKFYTSLNNIKIQIKSILNTEELSGKEFNIEELNDEELNRYLENSKFKNIFESLFDDTTSKEDKQQALKEILNELDNITKQNIELRSELNNIESQPIEQVISEQPPTAYESIVTFLTPEPPKTIEVIVEDKISNGKKTKSKNIIFIPDDKKDSRIGKKMVLNIKNLPKGTLLKPNGEIIRTQ